MSGSLGEAVLDLAADGAGLIEDINKTRPKALGALSELGRAGGLLLAAGITVAAAAVVGIAALMWNSANTLDAAYDNIQTKTGATGERLEALKEDFREVFTSVPEDADKVSEAVSILNQRLGLTGPALQDTSKNLLEMTRITGGDLQSNGEAFTRMVGDWSIPLEDASGSLDMVYKSSTQTGIGTDRLMQLMVQFGAPMRQFGFSMEESAALLGKWEKEGVNTELVMGSLRIAAGKFANEGKPLQEGLKDTFEAIKNAETGSEGLALAMDVFGARAGPDMAAAIREGRFELGDMISVLQDADGAILDTAAATMDWGERLQLFKNRVTTAFAPAGEKLMQVAGRLMDEIARAFERPDVQKAIEQVSVFVEKLADDIGESIPVVIDNFFKFFDWLKVNQPIVVGILAALGVAILAFGFTVASAAWTAMAPLLPVIAIMALVGAAAYLLYRAWTENWGGIQQKAQAVWAYLQPIFQAVSQWLQVNIPQAIAALVGWWNGTLMPALQSAWSWISANILPLLHELGRVIDAVLGLAITALAGYFQNTLMPKFQAFSGFINGTIMPAVTKLSTWLSTKLKPAFDGITNAIKKVTDWLSKLADSLSSVELPEELTPGSPTPFETGLWGINKALKSLAKMSLPTIAAQMQVTGTGFTTPAYAMASTGMATASGGGNTFYAPVTFEVKDKKSFDELMRTLRK
jgi:hypothetical protein